MPFKGGIFDLDGVVVDTVDKHFKAWKKVFNEYGREFSFREYKEKVDGIPRIDGVKAVMKGEKLAIVKEIANKKQKYFIELVKKEGVKVYETTLKLIKELRENKIKVACISASKNCKFILEKVNLVPMFDVIVTGKDIKKGKPDPEVFHLAMERLNLKPSECIVFEDAYLGVEAAKEAGIKCVGIDRYGNPDRLKKADKVVKDLSEVNVMRLREMVEE